jgi:hypothetical protein
VETGTSEGINWKDGLIVFYNIAAFRICLRSTFKSLNKLISKERPGTGVIIIIIIIIIIITVRFGLGDVDWCWLYLLYVVLSFCVPPVLVTASVYR